MLAVGDLCGVQLQIVSSADDLFMKLRPASSWVVPARRGKSDRGAVAGASASAVALWRVLMLQGHAGSVDLRSLKRVQATESRPEHS
jgi:hypothetical protein